MDAQGREGLINTIEQQPGKRRAMLKQLGIPPATYYQWRAMYNKKGIDGLTKSTNGGKAGMEQANTARAGISSNDRTQAS